MTNKRAFIYLRFLSLGEYVLHYRYITPEGLGPARSFNCAIHNGEELATERVQLFVGEELHRGSSPQATNTQPLLRFDEFGLWLWMPKLERWWPLRGNIPALTLDRQREVRVKS